MEMSSEKRYAERIDVDELNASTQSKPKFLGVDWRDFH